MSLSKLFQFGASLALLSVAQAEDGYRLWLRYDRIADATLRQAYAAAIFEIVLPDPPPPRGGGAGSDAEALAATRDELVAGLSGLLGSNVPVVAKAGRDGALIVGTARN